MILRLLVDENVHGLVVRRLREAGMDVEAISESSPGTRDADILDRPDIGTVVLVTYDRDFGELLFKDDRPPPAAVIYSRLGRAEPRFVADEILALIKRPLEAGFFYVIAKDGVRSKPLAPGNPNNA